MAEVLSFNQNSIDERIKRRKRKFFGRTGKGMRKELPLFDDERTARFNPFENKQEVTPSSLKWLRLKEKSPPLEKAGSSNPFTSRLHKIALPLEDILKINCKFIEREKLPSFAQAFPQKKIINVLKYIILTFSDEEILFILSHEFAHIIKLHKESSYQNEFEADKLGLILLVQAGITPQDAAVIAAETLMKRKAIEDNLLKKGILIPSIKPRRYTHPSIEARINRLNLFLKEVKGQANQEGATLTMPCPTSVQGVAEGGSLPVSSLKRKIKGSSSPISSDYKEAFKKALEGIKPDEAGLLNPYFWLRENKLLFNPIDLWGDFLGEETLVLAGISAVMEEIDVLFSKWQKLLKPKQAQENFLSKIEELIYGLENDFVVVDEEYDKLDLEILKRLRELLFIYDWQELDELIKFWYEWELLRVKCHPSIQKIPEIERKLYSTKRGLTKIWMRKIAEKVSLDLGVKESLVRAVLSEGIKGLDIDRKLRVIKLIYKYLSFIKNKEEFLRCLQEVMDEIKERKDTLKKYKKIKKTSYYSWLRNERKKAFQILFSSAKEDFLIRERLKTISAMFRHGGWQRVFYEEGVIYLLGDVDKRFERIGEDVIGVLKELTTLAGKVKEKDEIREEDIEEWRKVFIEAKEKIILLYEEYKKLAEEVNLEEKLKELKVPEYIAKYSGRDIYIQLYQRLQKDFPELVKFISLLNDFIEGKLDKEIVSLRPILEKAIKDAYVYHQEKDLKIHLNIEKEIQLNTNSYALKIAILRILSNGFHLKLTKGIKNIYIKVSVGWDEAIIIIEDDGKGINKELFENKDILERPLIFQYGKSTRRKERGTGVGTNFVWHIIYLLGGDIFAGRGKRYKGARFEIRLERVRKPPSHYLKPDPLAEVIGKVRVRLKPDDYKKKTHILSCVERGGRLTPSEAKEILGSKLYRFIDIDEFKMRLRVEKLSLRCGEGSAYFTPSSKSTPADVFPFGLYGLEEKKEFVRIEADIDEVLNCLTPWPERFLYIFENGNARFGVPYVFTLRTPLEFDEIEIIQDRFGQLERIIKEIAICSSSPLRFIRKIRGFFSERNIKRRYKSLEKIEKEGIKEKNLPILIELIE
ncbi:MAG TPA: hypothetical protein ENI31_01690, partial [Candidatus Omnitrophica bacterium]|nr:hypothetical protein [Candidatus Omnitrophota bacterium]